MLSLVCTCFKSCFKSCLKVVWDKPGTGFTKGLSPDVDIKLTLLSKTSD